MLNRPIRLLAGMVVAVVGAGVLVSWMGTGVWRMVAITTVTTQAARLIFDDTLARSYAAFHGAVVGALGSSGVIPEQLIEAALGACRRDDRPRATLSAVLVEVPELVRSVERLIFRDDLT